ncbi:MAG: hypothetical protein IKD54_02880 [Clostridia bacterium]|nr:hypothetical protein [Clostridia bacterium]
MNSYRIEHDSMGEVRVPNDKLWGRRPSDRGKSFPYRALFLPFTYQSNKALKNRQFINVRTKSRGYGLYGIYGQRATHTKMGNADFIGFLNRNEFRFISKVSQNLKSRQNEHK